MQTGRTAGRLIRLGAITAAIVKLAAATTGCQRQAEQYKLSGQIVAVDPTRQELTIQHQDIPGFMPGMTMAFKVFEPRLMDGRTPGELVTATLVVKGTEAYLRNLSRTGFARVAEAHAVTRVMDLLEPGEAIRDATLLDETGTRHRLTDWQGHILAVTFVYTRCPLANFCPLMDRHFAAVQKQVQADAALRDRVRLVSVSIDPEHDRPDVLAKHAAGLGADRSVWQFLTGDREEVNAFASQFGVSVMREGTVADDIVHNLRTAIIDGEGKLMTSLNGSDWSPADLVAEIRRARARH